MDRARLTPFLLSLGVFILDRLTKQIIRTGVSLWENITVIPGFFYIVHAENKGAAFGFLSESASPLRTAFLIVLSAAVMVFIAGLLWSPARMGLAESWLSRCGLALVLGGAAGNLYDRIFRGAVTDFLEFYFGSYVFPAFNIADTAISIGAGLLLLEMWRTRSHKAEPSPADSTGGEV
jgi:signal peptidase II